MKVTLDRLLATELRGFCESHGDRARESDLLRRPEWVPCAFEANWLWARRGLQVILERLITSVGLFSWREDAASSDGG